MKKISFVLMSVVLMFVIAACSNDSSSASDNNGEETKSISILTPYLSSVTTKQMVDEIEKKAKENNWDTNVVDTAGDAGALASRMEDVISANTDAIVLVSTDPNQLQSQFQLANENDIPVFGSDSSYIEGMTLNATSDNDEMSKMITEHLFEQMDEKGNLIVLTHRPHPGVLKRTEKLDEMLKDYPDINVITEQEVKVPGPIENSRKQMENLLLSNKGEDAITAVWAGWDEPAIGATQAIQADGREGIIVTGIDGNSQAIELINEGSPLKATVKQNFVGMAEIVIEQMDKYFETGEVDDTELYAPAELVTAK
ncbi:monosaccharide ABC transporter substrate-binding protein, CUT2 family [Virgibacillus subterraneus]|uniref:Monosaccharide ABC transporter substrate-binding protein, CUT2 family n=1 Tax=Virgibacillus subterraneus TaxID=621109 RepID=A0A1H9AQ56_9BACI|nr:sugar ABC transporter substrate-binding protein [Virgibacillus subterraneus]SEP78942.1 monosaccharide ABC transporter substrate-binding protein, CUT2 family [Virgibacillus subterraneus]